MPLHVTGVRQRQAWREKVLPPVEKVRDGVWSIPVPIPENPLRYVLVYVLDSDDGPLLIDAGWDDDGSWAALQAGMRTIGSDVRDVRQVLVTHYHADHLGLAGRVREASGAVVAMHGADVEAAAATTRGARTADRMSARMQDHLVGHGASHAEATDCAGAFRFDVLERTPVVDRCLVDGDRIPVTGGGLDVIWTPGHSPGHSCFYDERRGILFSGDHVLPRISPQIAMSPAGGGHPLEEYLRSLARLDQLGDPEVMPAHEYRFRGLSGRLTDLVEHHTARLLELRAAVDEAPGSTAWALAARLSWSRSWAEFDPPGRRFALGETLAHLMLLESRGEIGRKHEDVTTWYRIEI